MPTNVRDPRTLITPDAFEISDDLLGTPLAAPFRRLWALLVDLAVIGLLTAFFDDIALLVWGVVALVLFWVTFQKNPARRGAASILLRVSTGCLGLVVLAGVAIAWLVITTGGGGPGLPFDVEGAEGEDWIAALVEAGGSAAALASVARDLDDRLRDAETADQAEEVALTAFRALGPIVHDPDDVMEVLEEAAPPDAAWSDRSEQIFERAHRRWERSREEDPDPGGAEPAVVSTMTDAEVLEAYAALLAEGDTAGAPSSPRARALRRRAVTLLAADTLEELRSRVEGLESDLEEEARSRRRAEATLEKAGSPFVALMRDVWEQLGSAIGLWSIYFTVLLTLWRGHTVGKRLLGLRVIRLDGEPINWWSAFERAGGYVAGLATGLLGFAQVFWDPNRQCIHDKIVGTVVVDTRSEKVEGAWQEAWTGEGGT